MIILSERKSKSLKSEITYALKHLQKVIWNYFIQGKKKQACVLSLQKAAALRCLANRRKLTRLTMSYIQ